MTTKHGNFKDLKVYRKAFELAMKVYKLSKTFPKDERYSLTDQIRRSTRSVCSNIAEGYRKRQYPAHFVSKVSDADSENSETTVWLDFAVACEYINDKQAEPLYKEADEIGKMLYHMMKYPERYS